MSDLKSGAIGWVDLTVPNAPALRDFYSAVVGWTPQDVKMGDYADYTMRASGTGEAVAGVCHAKGNNVGLPTQWLVYVSVPDLDASLAKIRSIDDDRILRRLRALVESIVRTNASQPIEFHITRDVIPIFSVLAHFMVVYKAEPGVEIIRDGDGGDFMLMVLEGEVEVHKRDRWNTPQLLATVEAGRTLGEMSMIDGQARFATCIATAPVVIAVLDRENLARIIVEQPLLGAKILMELVLMLSQRLRATSERLLGLLDEKAEAGSMPHHLL